jgi:hypothetical protein
MRMMKSQAGEDTNGPRRFVLGDPFQIKENWNMGDGMTIGMSQSRPLLIKRLEVRLPQTRNNR